MPTLLRTGAEIKHANVDAHECIITSWELLAKLPVSPRRWLVLDEADAAKRTTTTRTKAAVLHRNASYARIALTATPMSRDVDDLWPLLDLISPGLWGSSVWAFRHRYMHIHQRIVNGVNYGAYAEGLRRDRAPELASRLSKGMHVALHDDPEVASLLPPIDMRTQWISGGAGVVALSGGEIVGEMQRAEDAKVRALVESVAGDDRPVCVLSHRREMAERCAEALEAAGRSVVLAHGGTATKARLKRAEQAANGQLDLVSTMHALGIGIDLTRYRKVIFVELYWVARTIIQAMGRFRRLSSDPNERVVVDFLCQSDGPDVAMAAMLRRRIEDQKQLMRTGAMTAAMLEHMRPQTQEELSAALRVFADALPEPVETDPYLDGDDGDDADLT